MGDGMTIDWCEEHDSQWAGDFSLGNPYCWNWSLQQSESTDPANFNLTCRFVSMHLISDDALAGLVKLVRSEYPRDCSLADIAHTWGSGEDLSREQIEAVAALTEEAPV